MQKKVFTLGLWIVSLALIITACQPAATTEAPAAPTEAAAPAQPTAAPAEPTSAPPEPSGDKVQIRWFVGLGTGTDPVQIEVQEEVVADFNASQNEIELVLEVVPFDSARDTLSTQIASGAAPDIVGPVGWGGSNAFYGQWLDLTSYIQATGFDTSVFDPALVTFYQTEEGQVGLPFAVFPAATYFVPAMFDEAGLNYPPQTYGEKYVMPDGAEVDWNWDTLAEIARILTVDENGNDATSPDFDREAIVQVGYSPQWQTHLNYQGSYIAGADVVYTGDAPGSYEFVTPNGWKEAMQWVYDGMWGEQPFMATGPLAAAPEFGNGNLFNSGKAAMAVTPIWYTCCLSDFRDAGNEFQAAAIPMGADGQVHSRVDADTFRIWKGTQHPEEAFTTLSYLLTTGGDKLLPTYGAMPAIATKTEDFFAAKTNDYPFVTAETWAVFQAGLAYPDTPSAEQYQPNWNEAWARQQTFFDLLQNTPPDQLDFEAEFQKMVDDLNVIYNK
jgi:multiple sugar transport system substrate-binding protein